MRTLNDTVINVSLNLVQNKIVTFDDRDAPWMTEYKKKKVRQRDNIYNTCLRSSKNN